MIIGVAASATAQEGALQLPEIGDSSGALISAGEEQQIARELLGQLRRAGLIEDDPLVMDYINSVGWRLVAHSDQPTAKLHFFVMRDRNINAFATIGGLVAVNQGLILESQVEDEMAAVMAHEIAHVTQRHITRGVEQASKVQPLILLAMLGVILSGAGGDASQAAIVGGTGLMQQSRINFTRANEYEADRVGMLTLARAGYSPMGMPNFFGRLARVSRTTLETPPEFLRTHPVTTTRIAESKARAEQLQVEPRKQDPRFDYIRERIRVQSRTDAQATLTFYLRSDAEIDGLDEGARIYGLALAQIAAQDGEAALRTLQRPELTAAPELYIDLARVAALDGLQRSAEAIELLDRLHQLYAGQRSVDRVLVDLLLRSGDAEQAHRAVGLARELSLAYPEDPAVFEQLARAAHQAGDEVRAAEAKAEVFVIVGQARDALAQLKGLTRRDDLDYYQRARVEARIAQVEPMALDEEKRWRLERQPNPRGIAAWAPETP